MTTLGLVGAGSVASSPFARLPLFLARLGPVKSPSLRVASRIANTLHSGTPALTYEALARCRVIFIICPDTQVASLVEEMAACEMSWKSKSVVVCDTWLDSSVLAPLAGLGAYTASVCTMDPLSRYCLLEGERVAVREARRIVDAGTGRSLVVKRGAKPLIHAALTLCESLLFPLLDGADECLKLAGVPRPLADSFLEGGALRASRMYGKSGRKAWNGPLASGDAEAIGRQIEALSLNNPELSRFFADQCGLALQYFSRPKSWLPEPF
jgi:predicted short-subunit dehydrogenase-like oxidoreductase (DUF2520 family)